MVDQGSGAEIMYSELYKGLGLKPEDLSKYDTPLVGFDGRIVTPKGMIKLPVQMGCEVVEVDFIMVYAYSPYTTILARPWLYAMGTVSSTLHMKVKYPIEGCVRELQSIVGVSEVSDRMTKISVQCEELEKIVLGLENDKYFQIGTQLPLAEKEEFLVFLRNNLDVFARSTYEALRVDLEFICHHLNVNLAITPRRQQPRRSSKEHAEVVKEEFNKLKKAGAIKEVFLSIMVGQHRGSQEEVR
ncbi:uncharacterized protein LOC115955073 [Quercus lobata]|uniref:uncharacterized protein LOC115955073 n=1 Tax=Quercus lobata TaxID=97700 RepID=UPI0012479976|nr:uncharacterized protein LOC115955073 [Quercus lobata]